MLFLLKASIVIVILLIFYRLLLEKESFFAVNRVYLLASLLLAFILPTIVLPKLIVNQGVFSTWLEETTFQEQSQVIYEPIESEIKGVQPSNNTQSKENNIARSTFAKTNSLAYWLFFIYVFGVIVLTLHLFYQLANIFLVVRRVDDKVEDTDCTIYNIKDDNGPRSFFRHVFINPEKYNNNTYEHILVHEKIHVKQWHSIDLLLSEIAIIVLWFNPFVWLFRKEIERNIEYQTDDLVLESSTVDPQTYQMNLLKICVERKPLTIVSNYNQSLIKKRIIMMNKKKSHVHSYWKYAFIAPTLLVTLLMLNQPISVEAQEMKANESIVTRNIEIAGLVIDAESLLPIEEATIYDKNFGVLSRTNKDGYFKTSLDYGKTKGGIYFGFKVGKDDYLTFSQDENWGTQSSKTSAIYYLGISKKNAKSNSFSKHILNPSNLSLNSVLTNFKNIEENIQHQIEFNNKVEIAKRGNEDVFISIDESFYIVNDTGWIRLNSKDDLVSIDGKRNILASNLNSFIKRKQIKGMTPLSGDIPFEIYTK